MRKVPLSKKQKRAEKIKKTLIHVGIWLLGLLIVIALGVFAVRGFGIKTVIIDQSMNPTLQNEDVVLLNKLSYKIGSPKRMDVVAVRIGASENSPTYELSVFQGRLYRSKTARCILMTLNWN